MIPIYSQQLVMQDYSLEDKTKSEIWKLKSALLKSTLRSVM